MRTPTCVTYDPMRHFMINLTLFVLLSPPLWGQTNTYVPDTSLTYQAFLNQCINFKRQQKQEVWVVSFWATWNTNSLYVIPGLKYTSELFRNKPVRFINVSEDKIRRVWYQSLLQQQMPWEQLMIPRINDLEFLKRAFKYNGLPAIFIVTPNGQIRRVRDIPELEDILTRETVNLPNMPYRRPTVTPTPEEIPPTDYKPPTPEPVSPPISGGGSTGGDAIIQNGWLLHRVKKGETLYRLYVKYKVPVETIKRINGLPNNDIKVGQLIRIRRQP
ncbi:MAG: LysM peptidoglycan-binding domain-containing protein [Bacteroidota bacterium]